jgi:hypothetical protein
METFSIITFIGGLLVGSGVTAGLIGAFLFWLFSRSE